MKEIGILFQPDMVRAILAGRKTLTSRLRGLDRLNKRPDEWRLTHHGEALEGFRECFDFEDKDHYSIRLTCPYGQAGDLLIGRETYGFCTDGGKDVHIRYPADNSCVHEWRGHQEWIEQQAKRHGSRLRPGIHMPYWMTRLLMPVLRTWPERLQDMTEDQAKAEGVDPALPVADRRWVCAYRRLWDRINTKPRPKKPDCSWDANPWVWRVEFNYQSKGNQT